MLDNPLEAVEGCDFREICLAVRQREDKVERRNADSCGGIPADIRDKVFDSFFTTRGLRKRVLPGLELLGNGGRQ